MSLRGGRVPTGPLVGIIALLALGVAASLAAAAKPPRIGVCPIFPGFKAHQRRVRVKVIAYPGESDFGRAPIPPDARVERGSDHHVLVLQRGRCDLFEMFGARYTGGRAHGWKAASTAKFDLHSTKLHHEGWTSADAAGLPILPGLVRHGEVQRGAVRHAIRATFSQTRQAYIHPATHYASDECARDLPPMGLRLRLSDRYYAANLDRFPRGSQARAIFKALYHYGIINADNGGRGSNCSSPARAPTGGATAT